VETPQRERKKRCASQREREREEMRISGGRPPQIANAAITPKESEEDSSRIPTRIPTRAKFSVYRLSSKVQCTFGDGAL
jgi:hypothetical protein